MNDPDMGNWSYTYNALGQLITQTNAKNKTITNTYDNLGRLTTRVEDDGVNYTWNYDSAAGKALGKLASISGTDGYQKTLTYNDTLGQVISVTETLPNSINGGAGKTYTTSTTYDTFGRVDEIHYPTSNSFNKVAVKHHYTRNALTGISNLNGEIHYWKATAANADGNLISEELGNSVKTLKGYDTLGRITQIDSGIGSSTTNRQQLSYHFDGLGNLKSRNDNNQFKEDFTYDRLNRLKTTKSTLNGSVTDTQTMKYDGHGNIIRNGALIYTYETGGEKGGLHAVSKAGGNDYKYDANGNLLSGGGRSYTWTTFDKPSNIIAADDNLSFAYDDNRNRIIKDGNKATTWYVGGMYERVLKKSDQSETHKYYLKAGGKTVAYITQTKKSDNSWNTPLTRYLLQDHLGSTSMVLDDNGASVNRMSYTAWGKRRGGSGGGGLPWASTNLVAILQSIETTAMKLGFTGHEHDDEVGLINMKGRLYDATLGRFISADPNIQAATDTQSFNRYTYVKNNPLSYTDPSGYFFKKLFKSIGKFFKKYGRTILAIAVGVFTAGFALAAYAGVSGLGFAATLGAITAQGGSAFLGAVIAGAAGGFASGFIATGSLRGAVEGAVFGGLSAGLGYGIGHGGAGGTSLFGKGTAVAHGVAQGTVSVLRGGKFKEGFAGGFFGHMSSGLGSKIVGNGGNTAAVVSRTAISSVVGGTISKVVGGKFANGAVSAAFTHLFNHELGEKAHSHKRPKIKPGRFKFATKGASVGVGYVSAEGGDMYVFDDINQQTLHYRYLGLGPALSGGASGFREKGTIFLTDVSRAEGYAAALEGDFTFGVGINSTAQINPFNGLDGASSSFGTSFGFNFGAGLLIMNTSFYAAIPYTSIPAQEFSY